MLDSLKIPVIPLHLKVYILILALCKKMLLHQNEVITMHLTRRLKPYQDFFENMILLLYFTLCALMVRLLFASYPNFTRNKYVLYER